MVIDGAAEMDAPTSNNPEEFYNMLQSSFNRGAAVASSSSRGEVTDRERM